MVKFSYLATAVVCNGVYLKSVPCKSQPIMKSKNEDMRSFNVSVQFHISHIKFLTLSFTDELLHFIFSRLYANKFLRYVTQL